MNPLQAFRSQLGKLRRLAQPYFLPVEDTSGWQFLLLIVALLAVVVGSTLLLLTAAVAISGALIPELQGRFLPGVPQQVAAIWASPVGVVVMVLFALGLGCFGVLRGKLRQGRWLPWVLMGVITLLILVINGINVGISYIARNVDNTLVAYQADQFWQVVAIYAFCLVLALPIRALQSYLIPKLGLLWRAWLSGRLLNRYLDNRAYYVLNPNDESAEEIDNPDQRISQDAASFTSTSLSVSVEIVSALLTFVSFILVLWTISTKLALWLLAYSLAGTAVIVFASRKLVALNYDQLRLEADFRYGLVHIRDNAESIAFYRGEQQEGREAERRLGGAIRNYNKLIVWEALISVIQRSYDYFSRFLPWLVIAPIYFAKEVDFGVFGQASIAFSQVLFSVSYIVNNIDRLAAFSASISRLEGFQGKVEAIGQGGAAALQAAVAEGCSESLLVSHVDLVPPQGGRRLIHDLSLEVAPPPAGVGGGAERLRQNLLPAPGERPLARRRRHGAASPPERAAVHPPEALHDPGQPAGAALLPPRSPALQRSAPAQRAGGGAPQRAGAALPRLRHQTGLAAVALPGGTATPGLRPPAAQLPPLCGAG